MAIALTLLALALLMLWEENYGYVDKQQSPVANGSSITTNGNGTAAATTTTTTATTSTSANGKTGPKQAPASTTAVANGDSCNGSGHSCNGGVGAGEGSGEMVGLRKSVSMAWGCIVSDHRVLLLGMVQSLFEGGTFTFGELGACLLWSWLDLYPLFILSLLLLFVVFSLSFRCR